MKIIAKKHGYTLTHPIDSINDIPAKFDPIIK